MSLIRRNPIRVGRLGQSCWVLSEEKLRRRLGGSVVLDEGSSSNISSIEVLAVEDLVHVCRYVGEKSYASSIFDYFCLSIEKERDNYDLLCGHHVSIASSCHISQN